VIRGTVDIPFLSATTPIASSSASVAPSITPTPTPTPTPTINPALAITVLNGTSTKGLANAVGDNLVKQGWLGASTSKGSRSNTATPTITKTVVYYGDAANESAAKAMALSLKIGTAELSTAYPNSPLTVVLGTDYVLPTN
jgi:hypothetical protein